MPRSPQHVAYEAARMRLQNLHEEQFHGLLNEEREKLGLPPTRRRSREQKISQLEEALRLLKEG